jgi:hypothetical protein
MEIINLLAPALLSLCVNNFITGQGEFCNPSSSTPPQIQHYEKEKSCYRDGVFYPRCADYDDPLVQHYHKILKKPGTY